MLLRPSEAPPAALLGIPGFRPEPVETDALERWRVAHGCLSRGHDAPAVEADDDVFPEPLPGELPDAPPVPLPEAAPARRPAVAFPIVQSFIVFGPGGNPIANDVQLLTLADAAERAGWATGAMTDECLDALARGLTISSSAKLPEQPVAPDCRNGGCRVVPQLRVTLRWSAAHREENGN